MFKEYYTTISNLHLEIIDLHNRSSMLSKLITARQDLDIGVMHDVGYVVVVVQVGSRDYVKVIPIQPSVTISEYKHIVQYIKENFGATVYSVDTPIGITKDMLLHETEFNTFLSVNKE